MLQYIKIKRVQVRSKKIKEGLNTVIHTGRFKKICKNPDIIYDEGHNVQEIKNLKETLYMNENGKIILSKALKDVLSSMLQGN